MFWCTEESNLLTTSHCDIYVVEVCQKYFRIITVYQFEKCSKIKKGTVSVAVYGYRTHWFRRRIRLYNQNETYNSVAVYGYGTNSPWNGSVAVQNRPLSMYESSQSFICAGKLRIDCFPDLCKLVVHYLGLH